MISLRDIESDDLEMIRDWRNMPEVAKYMYTDHQITDAEHRQWFERIQSDPTCRHWIIVCDDIDVGAANIYDIDTANSRCFWGSYIARPSNRQKGTGAFVRYTIFNYVFEDLNLNKLCAEVMAFNNNVLRAHKKTGLTQEGVFREHAVKGGVAHDVVYTSLLRREWQELKPDFEGWLRTRRLL